MIISEKPWSLYTSADYSIEQWHDACLIHFHDGEPTSKGQCKLPVKTPSGTINRNGVHAAAAALAGARGGVHASLSQKASASKALRSLYYKLDEDLPESLKQSLIESDGETFLEHYGKKGMKWGVRKARKAPQSLDSKKVRMHKGKPASALSNKQLKTINERMNLEQNYNRLNPSRTTRGRRHAEAVLATAGLGVAAYNVVNSPAGRSAVELGRRIAQGR